MGHHGRRRLALSGLSIPDDDVYFDPEPQLTSTGVDWGSTDTTFEFEVIHSAIEAAETLASYYNTNSEKIKLLSDKNSLKIFDSTLGNSVVSALGFNLAHGVKYRVAWLVGSFPRETRTVVSSKGVILFDSGFVAYEGDFSDASEAWLSTSGDLDTYSGDVAFGTVYKRLITDEEIKALARENTAWYHGPITFEGATTLPTVSSTFNLPLPAMLKDDVCIVHMASSGQVPHTPPAGWTNIVDSLNLNGDAAMVTDYKVMGATPDTVYVCTDTDVGEGYEKGVMAHAFRGIEPTQPLDVLPVAEFYNFSKQPDPPAITTVTPHCMIVSGANQDQVRMLLTPPAGFINHSSVPTGSGDAATGGLASRILDPAETIDPDIWGGTGGGNGAWSAVTIALKPKQRP
jgi:hypothetical protein